MSLKRLTQPVMATSVGSLSMLEAPKNPTTPLVLRRMNWASSGSGSGVRFVPYSEAYEPGFEDMERRLPDISKIARVIGWRPTMSLQDIVLAQAGVDRHIRDPVDGIGPAHGQQRRGIPHRHRSQAVLVEGLAERAGNGPEVQPGVVCRRPAPGMVAGTDGRHRSVGLGRRHRGADRQRRHGPALGERPEHRRSPGRHVLPGHAGHRGEHDLSRPRTGRRRGIRRCDCDPDEDRECRQCCESCGEKATGAPPDGPHSLRSPPRRRPRICS